MRKPGWLWVIALAAAMVSVGCKHEHDLTLRPKDKSPVAVTPAPTTQPEPTAYHLHLNGIGGYRFIDKYMLRGLQDAGLEGEVRVYDWTGTDVGLGALLVTQRHQEQSAKVAELILAAAREQPGRRITITCHSGGAGIAVWALQRLPDDVKVESIVMLASALSPEYDLSPALRHVNGKIYSFYSSFDSFVLGFGTKTFGTIDGVKTDAAGKVGFRKPPHPAYPDEYDKLVQIPYSSAWMKMGNIGDHIGWMSRSFARQVVAPMILEGILPTSAIRGDVLNIIPATIPATGPATGPSGLPWETELEWQSEDAP